MQGWNLQRGVIQRKILGETTNRAAAELEAVVAGPRAEESQRRTQEETMDWKDAAADRKAIDGE